LGTPAQANLFTSRGAISVDAGFHTATRTALDPRSWVEIVPFWLSGADALFMRLRTEVPWKEHYRRLFDKTFLEPRLTAEYGRMQDAPPPLAEMADVLSRHYRIRYDSLWLNLYRDGRDSTGWHVRTYTLQNGTPLSMVIDEPDRVFSGGRIWLAASEAAMAMHVCPATARACCFVRAGGATLLRSRDRANRSWRWSIGWRRRDPPE